MRVGIGYDVHPLVSGRNLVLGGVQIPYNKGLSGHSDADVLTHAVIDALLGAAGLKDIGNQFPPEDPKYKSISSLVLLEEVNKTIRSKGFKIINIDVTVVAENPKVSPFIDDMCNKLCQTLKINPEQIMVKATTTDGIGSIGKGQGIASLAIVSVE
jgi:2-C-methyl-D-erythritol 2,4-cyclodiphosphate synthase